MTLKPSQHLSFSVQSDLIYLEEVLSKFETIKQPWIPEKDWFGCKLALAEGFTNAVRHAHRGKPSETPIEICLDLSLQEITIQIWDYGQPFSLDLYLTNNLVQSEDELSTRGRGIAIMQKIADEITYSQCPDQRNCLLLKIKLFSELNKK